LIIVVLNNWLLFLFEIFVKYMLYTCDGASLGNIGISACGGIFRNVDSSFLGAYAFNIGVSTSLKAELIGAMIAIETAAFKGWSRLWLESDSMLVVHAFSSSKIVP
jgi:ribonuclease HI